LHTPGPGLFPFALGILLCLVSLGLAARARWMREAREAEPAHWRRIVLPLGLLVVYALLLETAGFPLASTLLMLCFFRGVDPIPWPYAVGGSLAAGVGSYLVFKHLLAVQLPAGLLLPF
jgi:putative tricarboxylic transport membrane protein